MKKKIIGTGITQREVVSYDMTTSEDAPAIYKMMKGMSGPNNFESLILKPIEETSWRLLEQAGLTRKKLLKTVEWYCKITAGKVTGPGKDECNLIMAAATLTHDKPDSKEGYRAHWLNDIRSIRMWSKEYLDLALQQAFQLGQSYREAAMKFLHEKAALRGLPFLLAPTKPRMDALNEVLWEMLNELRKVGRLPTANKVWNHLKTGAVIQEIDNEDDVIF